MSVLKVTGLTKKYNNVSVVDDVSFDITEGSITGFLGPNGAGKSTTMNAIMGFIGATSGDIEVFGQKVTVNSPKTRRDIGFLSNSTQLDRHMLVRHEIEYYGNLAGGYDKEYVASLIDKLQLDVNQKIGGLSTGNYQKVSLIIALMHKPKLLILDEPTNGLDPLVQAEFNKIILDLKQSGSTIFISSHILSEVQELCDNFIFIRKGKIVSRLTQANLVASAERVVMVRTNDQNHDDLINYLRDNNVDHTIEAGDLESVFMDFYKDEDKVGGEDA